MKNPKKYRAAQKKRCRKYGKKRFIAITVL